VITHSVLRAAPAHNAQVTKGMDKTAAQPWIARGPHSHPHRGRVRGGWLRRRVPFAAGSQLDSDPSDRL